MHERRFDPAMAGKLDAPERKTWLPVEAVLARLALQPDLAVADVGAGTGYFALPIAEVVGASGKVYAVDVEPQMLAKLQARVAESHTVNVHCVHGEASATNIPDSSCDLILMANVWHEFDSHSAVLGEAARILKPAGRIAILDWCADLDSPPGPPKAHRIAKQAVCDLLAASGWKVLYIADAGMFSYLVMASRPD